jgi:GATA-binding protein
LASSLDISPQDSETRSRLLKDSLFPSLKDDAVLLDSLEHLQAQDPLGTQIWRLFSNTKAQLPNSDRFQNLTWRMMHMNLKKLEAQNQRLVHRLLSSFTTPLYDIPPVNRLLTCQQYQ